ncbi:hypothetical protein TNCV_1072281 [Trichonephila clavipes]|nr:hypothetical protein TNCV_1072281 [Trichonephila clavipes]
MFLCHSEDQLSYLLFLHLPLKACLSSNPVDFRRRSNTDISFNHFLSNTDFETPREKMEGVPSSRLDHKIVLYEKTPLEHEFRSRT